MGVQALVLAVLVAWAVHATAPPDDPFSRLMHSVRDDGAVAAAQKLGPDIQKAARPCPPDQLALTLARALSEGCATLRADPHQIIIQCGARQLTVPRWADGFRASATCPPFLAGL
ncbi:MAG: hypothetical protein ACI9U2_005110 [Bradymonadia bacterium]